MDKFNFKEFLKPTKFKTFAFLIIFAFRILRIYNKGILDTFTIILTIIFSYIIAAAVDMLFKGLEGKKSKTGKK